MRSVIGLWDCFQKADDSAEATPRICITRTGHCGSVLAAWAVDHEGGLLSYLCVGYRDFICDRLAMAVHLGPGWHGMMAGSYHNVRKDDALFSRIIATCDTSVMRGLTADQALLSKSLPERT